MAKKIEYLVVEVDPILATILKVNDVIYEDDRETFVEFVEKAGREGYQLITSTFIPEDEELKWNAYLLHVFSREFSGGEEDC